MLQTADLILSNARIRTLDRACPEAEAIAIRDGRVLATGPAREVMAHAGPETRLIDAGGRRVIPGLIDSHMHIIRGGLNYNMELRWDGVRSLADAMAMLKQQVAVTPPPQWVRVVGGFTEHQFVEKRLPTLDEINAIAPDTPVFILHLYDRALLNAAALRAVGYTKDTPDPPGAEIVRDPSGSPTGLLIARPNAGLLYATLAKGPKLPPEYQKNSTRHFMREVNRLGVTGVIDAGGGFQNYPDDYAIIEELHRDEELTLRIAYNLFTQTPKGELADFTRWTGMVEPGQGDELYRHNGAGEMLVFSAADFEDFREPRPDLSPSMEPDLKTVVRHLAEKRWPFRLHATYDETVSRALDVFEEVDREVGFQGLRWFFDHAETITPRSIDRVKRLGGGIAVQHRMVYQGEDFVARYGAAAAEETPPVARMLEAGVPVGGGTDATRVASYNPRGRAVVAGLGPEHRRAADDAARPPAGSGDGIAPLDRGLGLVLGRGGGEGPARAWAARGSRGAERRLFLRPRGCDPGHHRRAHGAGRARGAWLRGLRSLGAGIAPGHAGLVAREAFRRLPVPPARRDRQGRGLCLRERVLRAWTRPCLGAPRGAGA